MPLTAGKVHAAQIAWLQPRSMCLGGMGLQPGDLRSEEHTSELQSQSKLVCRLLLEKKTLYTPFSSMSEPPSCLSLSLTPRRTFTLSFAITGCGRDLIYPSNLHAPGNNVPFRRGNSI